MRACSHRFTTAATCCKVSGSRNALWVNAAARCCQGRSMQDHASELPRTLLPRTRVNKAAFSEERRPRRNRPVASSFAALLLVRRVRAEEEGAYLLLDPALLA